MSKNIARKQTTTISKTCYCRIGSSAHTDGDFCTGRLLRSTLKTHTCEGVKEASLGRGRSRMVVQFNEDLNKLMGSSGIGMSLQHCPELRMDLSTQLSTPYEPTIGCGRLPDRKHDLGHCSSFQPRAVPGVGGQPSINDTPDSCGNESSAMEEALGSASACPPPSSLCHARAHLFYIRSWSSLFCLQVLGCFFSRGNL